MTVSEYLLSAKLSKLTVQEMEEITIGMVFDHIDLYVEITNPQKEKEKEATQEDIQRLKGR